jgi:NAD+ synthase
MTTLQKHIIETLGVKAKINPEEEFRTRVDFLKAFTKNAGTRGFVLGISGGQDSALAGYVAQTAVRELRDETGKDYEFLALLLPYGTQRDGDEAVTIAKDFIKADQVIEYNIKDTVDAFANTFNTIADADPANGDNLADYHKGNVKARVRAITQYAYAGQRQLLVVGTDHAAEAVSGFFTKFGDGAADILPLSGLNKRQGKEVLRFLGAPEFVITKAPTADLLDTNAGQADETELGITYDVLDDYLEGKTVAEAAQQKIELRYMVTEHKRQQPVDPFADWWK